MGTPRKNYDLEEIEQRMAILEANSDHMVKKVTEERDELDCLSWEQKDMDTRLAAIEERQV